MYKETATTTAESSVHESLKKTQHKKLEKTHLHNLKLSLSVKRYQGPLGSVFFLRKNSKVWNRICKGGHKSRNSFKSIVPDLPGHDLKLSRDEKPPL